MNPDGSAELENIGVPPNLQKQGLGTGVLMGAKDLSDQLRVPHSWVKVTAPDYFNRFPHLTRTQTDPTTGWGTYQYNPQRISAVTGLCPTCGDPLQGEFGTYCPRCQWVEHDVNADHDPLSNPPDPTVDMHRGIQSRTSGYEPFTFSTGKQMNVDWDRGTIQDPEDPETEETFDDFLNNMSWHHRPQDFAPYPDPHEDFWRQPQVVYHGTDEENIPTIMQEGLQPRNKTRGIQNRGIGAAIFTSPDASTAQYHYGPTLAIDAPRMKADGYMPQVGSDGFDDAWHRESIAAQLEHEWHDEGNYGGEDPSTVVFHEPIPAQYLTRVDDPHQSRTIPSHRHAAWYGAVEDF